MPAHQPPAALPAIALDRRTLLKGGARGIVNSLLAEYARSEPVYRLEPDLLDKLPAGRRVERVAIERGVAVVHLD